MRSKLENNIQGDTKFIEWLKKKKLMKEKKFNTFC